ncbi:MAG TPA: hypothetical protein DD723_02475 [Candidatus Omnitrophica bacterium]|nr:MAG: hypothetical protein A2Z81_01805 [Omnitrophica WOR_2 bacterium GWA2_45_18]OGX19472.1 MAG: hypothetical protein A2Y04_06295 [Omnitrophica WOR_2 bacterium GWC2_45_7]HBR14393.1 hypothetical protein [Candidatus Omnitrophota bacterium]
MIKHPLGIVGLLLMVEAAVLYVSSRRRFKRYFSFLPPVFWIYFLPMVLSSVGLLDAQSEVYALISKTFLPASLILLLLCVDVKAILKLGRPALIMMLAGSAGIMIGTPMVFYLFKGMVGENMWAGFGALSASWTGGSANMIAVKEALGTPDDVYLPMVIVDTLVPYIWMGTLVGVVGMQSVYDRWNRSDMRMLEEIHLRVAGAKIEKKERIHFFHIVLLLAFAFLAGHLAAAVARMLPTVKDVISTYAWTIILISVMGLVLSLTPAKKMEQYGSTRVGYFLLYLVLTTIGAKANLSHMGSSFLLIIAGFMMVGIHAVFLLGVARLIRAPLFLVAVASQANIGGVASAPIVAEVYRPGLASVGLLMAILGGILGTYLGIVTGHLCKLFI